MIRETITILALATALPAHAEAAFRSDAFGLSAKPDDARAAWAGLSVSEDGQGEALQPGEVDAILFFVGPKSLVAGKDDGHAVGILLDRHGNLVIDRTAARITAGEGAAEVRSRDGIADWLFRPAPKATTIFAGMSSGPRQSARAIVRIVTDLASVTPVLRPSDPDGIAAESLFDIETLALIDRFGNVAEDGVALDVAVSHPGGRRTMATAVVQGGIARATLLSRNMQSPAETTAALGPNGSPETPLAIGSIDLVPPFELRGEVFPDIDAIRVAIGPIRTSLGHVIHDGTDLSVSLSGEPDRGPVSTWVRDGYAELMLPIGAAELPATLELTILGKRYDLSLDRAALSAARVREIME